MTKNRSEAQRRADERYEETRKAAPRFGGRCTPEQKAQIERVAKLQEVGNEKEAIFKALTFFEQNYK